jgi:transposase
MATIDYILTLHQRGWSQRRIARELNIDRETVARHLRVRGPASKPANAPLGSNPTEPDSKPANAPIGSDAIEATSKPANAPLGSEAVPERGRGSDCEPWRSIVLTKLDQGLSAQRIFQDLAGEHNFRGSYFSVRRFVRRLGQSSPLPFRRLECEPAEEAQVDFGVGAPIIGPDGKRRRTHVFRIVLSHSRKAYSEAVFQQTTDNFLLCLENAFWSFGGTTKTVVLDNLKAAVTKADWFDPELNPKVRSFAEHYGIVFLPTRPRMPRHKGKVERGVDYVQENALKGRSFSQLEEENAFLRTWEQTVADTRVHGTIRQQVGKRFIEVERSALQSLPLERFPFFHESRRKVNRDGHIEVAKAYYSVPPEYLGRQVWVRWDGRVVRVFNDRLEPICVHVRQQPGRFSTHEQHIASQKIAGVERGATWLLGRICRLGSQASAWAQAMLAHRGIEGVRVLQGLLALTHRHRSQSIDRACGIALSYGAYRLRAVRTLIDRDAPKQEPLPFLEAHPLIRSLADYDHLVHTSFHKENSHE